MVLKKGKTVNVWILIIYKQLHHLNMFFIHIIPFIYIYIYICVCVCVCVCSYLSLALNIYIYVHIYLSIYLYIYIYIYIYIFTNLLSTSIHSYQKKKKKKKPSGTRDKNISNHRPGERRKNVIGQKERKGQPLHTSRKKSRDVQSVSQKKTKTCHKRCNATITRVLNARGANYKINLNRESEFSY